MRVKWIVNSIIVILFCLAAFLGLARRDSAFAAGDSSEKIEALLLDQIAADGSADFIVRFTEQADLSAAYSMDWDARGEFVYNTLRATAEQSQAFAKSTLDSQGLTYQTFIAGNELYVWSGSQATTSTVNALNELTALNELAALPVVSSIRATRTYSIDPVIETRPLDNISWVGDLLANHAQTTVDSSIDATKDWGITDTKADQFWTTFGVQGDGIVVANIDTGVQWDHPALDQAFKCGTNPSDPTCWFDPSNVCGSGGACDKDKYGIKLGHGTHTMGTMIGDDDPSLQYNVGMAPNAKWIACKGCESSTCSDLALNKCADWILAPGDNPANRPNVVNNSWGGGGGDPWFQAKVQAWVAAGIFPAFSAGNTPGCSTIGSPGDYQESFGSAAHDISRNIASFSSRGPSAKFGDTPYTKPNISTPGAGILSTVPTSSWGLASGTSMASPHAAGAVALLWSCNPGLVGKVDATFQLLQNNADAAPAGSCGAPTDGQGNYTYGYGYLDVLAAGEAVCTVRIVAPVMDVILPSNETTTISFTINNNGTQPLNWNITEGGTLMNAGVLQDLSSSADNSSQITFSLDNMSSSGNSTNVPPVTEGAVSFVLDDGSAENNVGVNAGGYDFQFMWFNRFTPTPADFPIALNQIQVFFDKLSDVNVGDAIDLVVYRDADGNPANGATLLATYHVTVRAVDGKTWSVYALPLPLLITGPGDILIGVINRYAVRGISPVTKPAALDQTTSQKRSWIGIWNTDPPDPAIQFPTSLALIDDFKLPGNWMIRASSDVIWLSEAPVSGTIIPGGSAVVNVTFDSSGLGPGVYKASLAIHTNNQYVGLITLPVTLSSPRFYLPIINK